MAIDGARSAYRSKNNHPDDVHILKSLGIIGRSTTSFSEDEIEQFKIEMNNKDVKVSESDDEILFEKDSLIQWRQRSELINLPAMKRSRNLINSKSAFLRRKSLNVVPWHLFLSHAAMFTYGLCFAVIGPSLSNLQSENFNDSTLSASFVVAINSIGALVGLWAGEAFYRRFNAFCVLTTGSLLCATCTLAIHLYSAPNSLLVLFWFQGLAIGLIIRGVHHIYYACWRKNFRLYQLLYFSLALGCLCSSLFVYSALYDSKLSTTMISQPKFNESIYSSVKPHQLVRRSVSNSSEMTMEAENSVTFTPSHNESIATTLKIRKPAVVDGTLIEPINRVDDVNGPITSVTEALLNSNGNFSRQNQTSVVAETSIVERTGISQDYLLSNASTNTSTFVDTTNVSKIVDETSTLRETTSFFLTTQGTIAELNSLISIGGETDDKKRIESTSIFEAPLFPISKTNRFTSVHSEPLGHVDASILDSTMSTQSSSQPFLTRFLASFAGLRKQVFGSSHEPLSELNGNILYVYLFIALCALALFILFAVSCCFSSTLGIMRGGKWASGASSVLSSTDISDLDFDSLRSNRTNFYGVLISSGVCSFLCASFEQILSNNLVLYFGANQRNAGVLSTAMFWCGICLSRLAASKWYKRLWRFNFISASLLATLVMLACILIFDDVVYSPRTIILAYLLIGLSTGYLAPCLFCWFIDQTSSTVWFHSAWLLAELSARATSPVLTAYFAGSFGYSPQVVLLVVLILILVGICLAAVAGRQFGSMANIRLRSMTSTKNAKNGCRRFRATDGRILEYAQQTTNSQEESNDDDGFGSDDDHNGLFEKNKRRLDTKTSPL